MNRLDVIQQEDCESLWKSTLRENIKPLQELTLLQEMAPVCHKTDGYQLVIEVYSNDHGVIGDRTNPAHAHLKNSSGKYLGKFAITQQPPRSPEYVFDVDKNQTIPDEYKHKIVNWATKPSPKYDKDDMVSNWSALKAQWRVFYSN